MEGKLRASGWVGVVWWVVSEGAHGEAILRKTRDDSVLGRISCQVPLHDASLDGAVVAPRHA
eukprot:6422393-Pyramimonas_sp.AAC.1